MLINKLKKKEPLKDNKIMVMNGIIINIVMPTKKKISKIMMKSKKINHNDLTIIIIKK